jgi:conjugal transfer/entry exclusion protein
MKKLLLIPVIALTVAFAPQSAQAQFGGIVFDPTNYANALLRYSQLVAQLNQLRSTYLQILNQYNLALQMSHNLPNMSSRYAASWAPWRYASAQDAYGNATPWVNGVNSGAISTVTNGYQRATTPLDTYSPSLLSQMPASELQRLQSDAASVELTDGAAQNAMETIGAIRANAVQTTRTIANIQTDSLSSNPSLNSEVGVLNKVNATSVLALQNAQDTNKLLVALLEQQTIVAKQLRDQAAAITNADIARRTTTVPLGQQLTGGLGQTLNTYRLP